MPVVEFSFPDKDLAQAGQSAQELRRDLIQSGIPLEHISLVREDPESMSIASQLAVTLAEYAPLAVGTVAELARPAAVVAELLTVAHTVYEVCFRERCALRVKTPKGTVRIGPGEIKVEKLLTVLMDALDVHPEQ
jgi:hypothetical protein